MTAEPAWNAHVEDYLEAVLRGDRTAALAQVRRLRDEGHEVLTLIHHLLAPAQVRVGELWAADTWSVAQEHAATAISEAVLAQLAQDRASAEPEDPGAPRVVVACIEQEWHALPALMVTEQLRNDGFAVTYLGANASAAALVHQIHETGPAAVLLSASLSAFLPLVRRHVEAVRATGTPVVVGGSAFDHEGRRALTLGATAFAVAAAGVSDLVRDLPAAVPPAPPLSHEGAEESFVVFGDRERLSDEAQRLVLAELTAAGAGAEAAQAPWLRVLDDQLPHVLGCIAGALVADDPTIAADALSWVDHVLLPRNAPSGTGAALRRALAEVLRDLPAATRLLEDVAARQAAGGEVPQASPSPI